MLDGGVGSIRLQPIEIGYESVYLMTASSTGTCHEGFPVGLSQELYGQCYDEIFQRGCVVRSLIGKLRFLPKKFSDVYRAYREVPELYLHV